MKTAVFFKAPPLQYPQSPRVGSSPHFGNPHTLTIHITYTMLALGWTPFASQLLLIFIAPVPWRCWKHFLEILVDTVPNEVAADLKRVLHGSPLHTTTTKLRFHLENFNLKWKPTQLLYLPCCVKDICVFIVIIWNEQKLLVSILFCTQIFFLFFFPWDPLPLYFQFLYLPG